MPKVTSEQFATKWAGRLSGATVEITNGVNSVSIAPSVKAIAKQDKMKANIIKSIDDGTWKTNLGKVTLEDWKDKMVNKGIPRISQGANDAKGKMQAFGEKLLPFQAGLQNTIKGMPDLNLSDSINRAVAWINGMSKFKK